MSTSSPSMTPVERRATLGLSLIYGLRLIGVFLIFPGFSLYALQLKDSTPTLIGMALGAYGLTQATLQIVFGAWSDRIGRKPVIFTGLLFLIVGSIVSGLSHSIYSLILGRALQGAGAIGSATMALVSDLTRDEQRTKAMAVIGITIGLSFTLAMLLGPLLSGHFSMPDLFYLVGFFGLMAIIVLYTIVPKSPSIKNTAISGSFWQECGLLLQNPQLNRLNLGIFALHAIFTASFIAIPLSLTQTTQIALEQQWQAYLPALFLAMLITFPLLRFTRIPHYASRLFSGAIGLLIVSEIASLLLFQTWMGSVAQLFGFFLAFTLLEAQLPALISKHAPSHLRGTALGIYSTSQFLGIFVGGISGGWLLGHYQLNSIYIACSALGTIWLAMTFTHTKIQQSISR